jgi:diguanylate cyclase (GGDEF)-like protein
MKKTRRKKLMSGPARFYVPYIVLAVLGTEALFVLQAKLVLRLPHIPPLAFLLPAVVGLLLGLALARLKVLDSDLAVRGVTDSLTGIHNRLWFIERLEAEVYRSKRYEEELAVIVLDIDRFRKINETYGQQAGDVALVEVTALVRGIERVSDMFARLEGEEFVVLLPNTSLEGAAALATRMGKNIEAHDFSSTEVVTCSFGVSVLRPDADSSASFLARAEEALTQAKTGGRNRVVALP